MPAKVSGDGGEFAHDHFWHFHGHVHVPGLTKERAASVATAIDEVPVTRERDVWTDNKNVKEAGEQSVRPR